MSGEGEMGRGKRHKAQPTDEWQELLPLFEWPEQEAYEELRPVVLFGVEIVNDPKPSICTKLNNDVPAGLPIAERRGPSSPLMLLPRHFLNFFPLPHGRGRLRCRPFIRTASAAARSCYFLGQR